MTEKRKPGRPRKNREPHSRYNFILPDRLIYAVKIMATVRGQAAKKDPDNSKMLADMVDYYVLKYWKSCMEGVGLSKTETPSEQLLEKVKNVDRLERFEFGKRGN